MYNKMKTQRDADARTTGNKPNLASFIIISTIAVPLLATGIIGLSAPEILPWPPNPTVAWSLLAVGGIMDVAAVFTLLGELRRVRSH